MAESNATAPGGAAYNYHHILDLQLQRGQEDETETETAPAAWLLEPQDSELSVAPRAGRRAKGLLIASFAVSAFGAAALYAVPMAVDLSSVALPAAAHLSDNQLASAIQSYVVGAGEFDRRSRERILRDDLACWSYSPTLQHVRAANGTETGSGLGAKLRSGKADKGFSEERPNGAVQQVPARVSRSAEIVTRFIADPNECLPAPYLYVTYHGGYEDYRVKNVCKYSRDGCSLGSVLLPDTGRRTELATTTTSSPNTTTVNATLVEDQAGVSAEKEHKKSGKHNQHHDREAHGEHHSEKAHHNKGGEKEQVETGGKPKVYDVHSLRGMMLSKGNLYVAEAWKENSLVLEYSHCLPEAGNRRELMRVLVGHQLYQETQVYNQTRDSIRGQTYEYESPEQISDLQPDSAEKWKEIKDAVEKALMLGAHGKSKGKKTQGQGQEAKPASEKMVEGIVQPEAGKRSLSAIDDRWIETEASWDRKQVNGLVHPYGFARAPHDPYLYVSSQDTFAVLRYDMETGQPGPMTMGALWTYTKRLLEDNARLDREGKRPPINYRMDDKALDILRQEMNTSAQLNSTIFKAIENGADELEIARAFRAVRSQRGKMFAGVVVDLLGDEIRGIVFDSQGRLYVADKQKSVRVYDSDGFEVKHTLTHVPMPISLAYDKHRNSIWIGSSATHSLYEIDAATWRTKQIITDGFMEHPAGLQIWGDSLFVLSQAQGKLLEFSVSNGTLVNVILDQVPDVGERVIMSPC